MIRFGKILVCGALAATTAMATGCGDDTTGSGSGGGSGGSGTTGSSGDGGGSSSGGSTTGPGSSGSGTTDTSSPASSGSSGAPASSGSGGTCGSGEGTPEELSASYQAYCEAATALADEVCGAADVQDCLDLEPLILQAGQQCEAEIGAQLDCVVALIPGIDPDGCTCDNDQLACPELSEDACAEEGAAADVCDDCNG